MVSTPQPSIICSYKSKFSAPTKASVASKQGCSHRIVWRPNNTLEGEQWRWESHCQYRSKAHLIYEELDTVHQPRPRLTGKTGKRRWSQMRKFSLARQCFCPHEPDPCLGFPAQHSSHFRFLQRQSYHPSQPPSEPGLQSHTSSYLSSSSKSYNFTCSTVLAHSTQKPILNTEMGNY